MTQRIRPNLSAAIYLGLACSVVLNGFTGFHARQAVLTALPSIVLLLCAMKLTALYLPYNDGKVAPVLVIALLLFAAGSEILALWQLYLAAYSGNASLGFVVAAVLIPTLYQRDKTALAQSSNFLLILLALAMLLMLVSVAPQLRITNLSAEPGGTASFIRAGGYELSMVPELLIAAILLRDDAPERANNSTATKSVFLLCLGRVAICVLLELFYGDAILWRSNAFHTATASGTISMFKRMEWLQLLLWTLAVSVKVALFFYAAWVIREKSSIQNADTCKSITVPVRGWLAMALPVAFFVVLMKCVDYEMLRFRLTAATWAVWLLITIGGCLRCALSTRKYGA